jgi:hypothetical protein
MPTNAIAPPQVVAQLTSFKWTPQRERAAYLLSLGCTETETADDVGVCQSTISKWKQNPDFALELDRLVMLTGFATKAERIRLAKKVIRQAITAEGFVKTRKDVLDWLKYLKSELDSIEFRSILIEVFGPALRQAQEQANEPLDAEWEEVIE